MDRLHSFTLADALRQHARSWPDKTAVVCGTDRYTYAELDARVNRLADAFSAHGLQAGGRVLWLGQNCHRLLEGLLACAKLGAAFCPANWRQSADEFAYVLDDLDPTVVLWQDAEMGDTLRTAREQATTKAEWIQFDAAGAGTYEDLLSTGDPKDKEQPVDPSTAVLLLYTAAFSGRPHAAMLSHEGLLAQNLTIAMIQGITPDEVYLNCGPLFHIATFMTTLATFHLAGTNVFTPRADAEEIVRLVDAEKCTSAFLVGPTIGKIVELNKDGKYDLSSLTAPNFGNKEFSAMVAKRTTPWLQKPGGYGQTEVTGLLTLSTFGNGPMAPGRPMPMMQVRIVGEDGTELPAGETGEIVARGPLAMVGYFNADDENERRQHGDWHHTNDLGRREPDGTITFIGPKTELIKTGVENVYPAEVEGALTRHPSVAEAVVIGVPDPVWDQSVKAVVKLHAGKTATEEEIIEHVKSLLASYKKPRHVDFVDDFPRQTSGWVDREAVKRAHGGGGTPGAGEK